LSLKAVSSASTAYFVGVMRRCRNQLTLNDCSRGEQKSSHRSGIGDEPSAFALLFPDDEDCWTFWRKVP
jgi:hypothetical protein